MLFNCGIKARLLNLSKLNKKNCCYIIKPIQIMNRLVIKNVHF